MGPRLVRVASEWRTEVTRGTEVARGPHPLALTLALTLALALPLTRGTSQVAREPHPLALTLALALPLTRGTSLVTEAIVDASPRSCIARRCSFANIMKALRACSAAGGWGERAWWRRR